MHQIVITIGRDGQVTIHVQGVMGTSCADLTAGLIAALGGQITQQAWTLEAYEQPTQVDQRADWTQQREDDHAAY